MPVRALEQCDISVMLQDPRVLFSAMEMRAFLVLLPDDLAVESIIFHGE
jgi:hypothetical protein